MNLNKQLKEEWNDFPDMFVVNVTIKELKDFERRAKQDIFDDLDKGLELFGNKESAMLWYEELKKKHLEVKK